MTRNHLRKSRECYTINLTRLLSRIMILRLIQKKPNNQVLKRLRKNLRLMKKRRKKPRVTKNLKMVTPSQTPELNQRNPELMQLMEKDLKTKIIRRNQLLQSMFHKEPLALTSNLLTRNYLRKTTRKTRLNQLIPANLPPPKRKRKKLPQNHQPNPARLQLRKNLVLETRLI